MNTSFIDAFPPARPTQYNTLAYVFPNLAFEHQRAVIRMLMHADYKTIDLPWVEEWMQRHAYRIVWLAKQEGIL